MSTLEEMLALVMRAEKIPTPERQYRFCERLWRADFAWPFHKLMVEVQGGIWNRGAHVRGRGYLNDCEKLNRATLMGYRVLYVCGIHIESGKAIEWIKEALSMNLISGVEKYD